jgi:hypothetical protein
MRFINTNPAQLIAENPRGVYRVTITRRPWFDRGVTERLLSWPSIVRAVLENSANAAGFPLTPDGTVDADDTTAVLDYRAASHPRTLTVQDLVNGIEESSDYIDVVSIERMPPVPRLSDGGADALAATRSAAQDAADQVSANQPGLIERLGSGAVEAAKGLRTVFIAGAVIAAVVAAIYFIPRPAKVTQ